MYRRPTEKWKMTSVDSIFQKIMIPKHNVDEETGGAAA